MDQRQSGYRAGVQTWAGDVGKARRKNEVAPPRFETPAEVPHFIRRHLICSGDRHCVRIGARHPIGIDSDEVLPHHERRRITGITAPAIR